MRRIYWELDEGQIVIYRDKKIVQSIKLTRQEYKTFKKMKDGKLYSKHALIYHIYNYQKLRDGDENNLKALIWRINRKIEPIGHIDNHYAWGYQLRFSIGEKEKQESK